MNQFHLEQNGLKHIPELLVKWELVHPLAISVRKQQQKIPGAGLIPLRVLHAAFQDCVVLCLPLQ